MKEDTLSTKDKFGLSKTLLDIADEKTDESSMLDAKTLKVLKELEAKSDEEAALAKADEADVADSEDSADEENSVDSADAYADDGDGSAPDDAILSDIPAEQIVRGVNEIFALYDDVELSDIPDEVLVLAKDGNLAAAYGAYKVRELEGRLKKLNSQLKNSTNEENLKLSMGEIRSAPKSTGITQQWLNCASTKDIEDNWDRIYPLIKSGKLKAF